MPKKVLYISASLGLGHITRDLAIVNQLRKQNPDVELSWLAAHPANLLLKEAGERLAPEANMLGDDNIAAEEAAREGYRLYLGDYGTNVAEAWAQNVNAFTQAISKDQYDLVVADESYEICQALKDGQVQLDVPFVMMYDFFGGGLPMRWNPIERWRAYKRNRRRAEENSLFFSKEKNTALFTGEPEDIPYGRLGLLLPGDRRLVQGIYTFTGYILPFDPAAYTDKDQIRANLDYGAEPLLICAIGGTAIGKELLTLCAEAYPLIRQEIPGLRMILVCGPRLDPKALDLPQEVEVRGYVPALYEHLAACDLAIVQGGGATTLELTALRRPFLYFPLEEHFEQQDHVATRLARHQAGIKMCYSRTTPRSLADKAVANLGKEVTYVPISIEGARRAAGVLSRLL